MRKERVIYFDRVTLIPNINMQIVFSVLYIIIISYDTCWENLID